MSSRKNPIRTTIETHTGEFFELVSIPKEAKPAKRDFQHVRKMPIKTGIPEQIAESVAMVELRPEIGLLKIKGPNKKKAPHR